MKKILSLLICTCIILGCTQLSASASETPMPRYVNILSENSYFSIDENGIASIRVSYLGSSDITAGATITIKMQKKFLLLFWQDVDIGDADGALVITTNASSYDNVIQVDVSKGTHRVQTEYVISNVNGGTETINREYEYKY